MCEELNVMESEENKPSNAKIKVGLYNKWLPHPLADKLSEEKERFHQVVLKLQEAWESGNATKTSKFVYMIESFLRVQSLINIEDVQLVVEIGLQVILKDAINIYAQSRWAHCLFRISRKYRTRIKLTLDWRPFHKILLDTHFRRQEFYKGLGTTFDHTTAIVRLVKRYRYYFSAESPTEIWSEFRPFFDDPCRTSCLEAIGFLSLFLPTKTQHISPQPYVFTNEWLTECFQLWQSISSCQFWISQWASLITRCMIMKSDLNWEPFMPIIFTNFLNSFRVPVGRCSAYPPVNWAIHNVPSGIYHSISRIAAQAIVNLLASGSSAQSHFEKLVDYLEPYYHPSNGGSWTDWLEHFLSNLMHYFSKRLCDDKQTRALSELDRRCFLKQILRLVERGQYSKSDRLAETCSKTLSRLSYIEPSLALPAAICSFETAMNSITATHQLEFAVTTLALCARPILILYENEKSECATRYRDTLLEAMFNTLPGLDANDPPKTLATLQLYCSVLSSLSSLEYSSTAYSVFPIDWERWTFDFLDRIFSLLQSLESGCQSPFSTDDTTNDEFLIETGSYYDSLLTLLLGKLPADIFKKALGRIKKFVIGNVLPGAVEEVACLCYAAVARDPSTYMSLVLNPIMLSLISTFKEAPSTTFCNRELVTKFNSKETLSPALETTATYQLKILASSISVGSALHTYKETIKEVIQVAFNAPSRKVNDAGKSFLRIVTRMLVSYYPLNYFKPSTSKGVETWIGTKDKIDDGTLRPEWHIPSAEEMVFVNELVDLHMLGPLSVLEEISVNFEGQGPVKDYLCVLLSRIEAVLYALGTCIPDFYTAERPYSVHGSFGATYGGPELRNHIALVLHKLCGYLLKAMGDESSVLRLLVSVINAVVNFGTVENSKWSSTRGAWDAERAALTEPAVNYLVNYATKCPRRPLLWVYQRVYIQNLLRSAETQFYEYYVNTTASLPPAVELLGDDILSISLHHYKDIRTYAGDVLQLLLQRYPNMPRRLLPRISSNLNDPKATEESVLGACSILKSTQIIRNMMEDWSCLSIFLTSILNSSHHDSTKVQSAIDKLFSLFNCYFGGLLINIHFDNGVQTYESIISHLKDYAAGDSSSVHWRYNLMAQGIYLFLTLSPISQSENDQTLKLLRTARGHFLYNLTSELPALRLLAAKAVLLLIGAESDKQEYTKDEHEYTKNEQECTNGLNGMHRLLNNSFGENIVKLLALDHHYKEDDDVNVPRSMSDIGLHSYMPRYMHDWPVTRTWDSKTRGVAFSKTFAKLFEELTRKYGHTVLEIIRRPLEDASYSTDERGKQCTAAEIISGVLRSNAPCVFPAWEEWLHTLLRKVLKKSTLESAPEWLACIRYAMDGSELRPKLLDCLYRLLTSSSSSSLIAKRLNFLIGALLEVNPRSMTKDEIMFQANLLEEVIENTSHSSVQVRKATGSLICILTSNIRSTHSRDDEDILSVYSKNDKILESFVEQASSQARQIQDVDEECSDVTDTKHAVREMETVFYFMHTCIKSGRFNVLADILVQLLHPLLLLQDTSEKDLTSLARSALRNLKWQVFSTKHLNPAVMTIVKAASEENWRVRVAAFSYVQPFAYRHSFILESSEWQLLWNKVTGSLCDPQLEVREMCATTAAGLMKGAESKIIEDFRKQALQTALSIYKSPKPSKLSNEHSVAIVHGAVLRLAACILSVPYDIPSWLPETVTTVTYFGHFAWPIRATVAKTIGEFRRTHSDTWEIQKQQFTDDQLELLLNSGAASYFA